MFTSTTYIGSSNVITDQNGQQAQYCEYTPYGTLGRNEGTDLIKHKFTGKELDNTGLYFYGARYYNPEIGRFITADTIVQSPYDPQSLNRYAYVRNNPLNLVDPTGNFWFIPALIVVAKAATVGAAAGAALGGVIGGVSAAASGTSFWAGFGAGMLSGAISGAAGGAAGGIGAVGIGGLFGAKAMSFWGTKLALGAFSGAVAGMAGAGFSGTSIGQGALWGAATGFGFTGIAISPIGQAIGRGISNTGFGRFLNSINNWVGSSYNDFINQVHGGSILSGVPETFQNTDEVWHATTKDAKASILKNRVVYEKTYVFNPDEEVSGVKLRDMIYPMWERQGIILLPMAELLRIMDLCPIFKNGEQLKKTLDFFNCDLYN